MSLEQLYKGKTQTCEKISEVLGWLSGQYKCLRIIIKLIQL